MQMLNPNVYMHNSRYSNVGLYYDKEYAETYHESIPFYNIIHNKEKDGYITINETNVRLDHIANKYYGNPAYWWVIANANNIFDAFDEIKIGTVLRIPDIMSLYYSNILK